MVLHVVYVWKCIKESHQTVYNKVRNEHVCNSMTSEIFEARLMSRHD